MEWKELTAAWLVAAALVGLSAVLHMASINADAVPQVTDPSRLRPTGVVAAEGAGVDPLNEEDNLATRRAPGWPAQHHLQICRVEVARSLC